MDPNDSNFNTFTTAGNEFSDSSLRRFIAANKIPKPAAGHFRAGYIHFSSTQPPYTRTMEVAQNVLQHFLYLIESKRKYLQLFLWLILNAPFATAAFSLQHSAKHSRLKTREALTALGWTVLPHPLYSPDLAPSVFHLFGNIKDAIRGKRFGIDDEVNETVKKWLLLRKSNWCKNALFVRWSIAAEVYGDCLEN
jgi:hypothetical protein